MTYDICGFMDKNKDHLFKDLSKAMYVCERGLLKELFPEGMRMPISILRSRNGPVRPPVFYLELRFWGGNWKGWGGGGMCECEKGVRERD